MFSFAQGIIHPYYTVALAPAVGALVGMGAVSLWERRAALPARLALAAATAATAGWAYVLLERSPAWLPWLRVAVLAAGLLAALGLAVLPRLPRRAAVIVVAAALVAALAGPTAYALDTVATAHTGAIPSAGPTVAGDFPGGGRPGGFGGPQGQFGNGPGAAQGAQGGSGGNGGPGAPPAGVFAGDGGPAGQGGLGGLLDAGTPNTALVQLLQQHASGTTWVAATVGANSAAGVELATGDPIMAIGGFNGTDPAPTLAQFQQLVAAGKVRYFLAGGMGGGPGGFGGAGAANTASQITAWVEQHFTATTVGGVTVYDLSAPTTSSGAATAG